jgi:hypothetical protein
VKPDDKYNTPEKTMYSFEELKTPWLTQKNFDPGRIPFLKAMGGWTTTLRRLDDAR